MGLGSRGPEYGMCRWAIGGVRTRGGEDWVIYPHLTGRETREWRNETRLVKWSTRMRTTRYTESRRGARRVLRPLRGMLRRATQIRRVSPLGGHGPQPYREVSDCVGKGTGVGSSSGISPRERPPQDRQGTYMSTGHMLKGPQDLPSKWEDAACGGVMTKGDRGAAHLDRFAGTGGGMRRGRVKG